jgi:DNA-binding NtrC family response regulator
MPSKRARVLIVDDDPVTCELLCEVFEREGFDAASALSGEGAIAALAARGSDLVVSDVRMKTRMDGLSLLAHLRREYRSVPVILMTAFGSIETAIRAVKEGAFDYVSKPFDIDSLVATVRRALAVHGEPDEECAPVEELETSQLVGRTPAMLEVYKMIGRVADSPACVLITGESGTGKELVARAIHGNGPRASSPFVAVNCGALTETLLESELFGHVRGSFTGAVANKQGLFEQAGDGTLFLDEVTETSPALQVKLLRVLQEREVIPVGGGSAVRIAARIIAASNRDVERLAKEGEFRRDLLYRLNVINVHLPPLRERLDDIHLLVAHLIRKHLCAGSTPPHVEESAFAAMLAYDWPGNVRELENVLERAVTLSRGNRITLDDLPPKVRDHASAPEGIDRRAAADALESELAEAFAGLPSLDEVERRYLGHVLRATGGNRKRAAEVLKVHRKTLYRMAERFGMPLEPAGRDEDGR